MADKDRIAELDKAIKDTRAELAAIQREKQTAANDPERLVLAEKRERRTSGTLDALERAGAYRPGGAACGLPEVPGRKGGQGGKGGRLYRRRRAGAGRD